MMKTESDLMKGIDDKFQKLLSQFEMNMNILEMKSKRQQFLIEQTKDDVNTNLAQPENDITPKTTQKETTLGSRKEGTPSAAKSSTESIKEKESEESSKERRETASEKSESMVTVKEIATNIVNHKPKTYSMKLEMKDTEINKTNDKEATNNADTMGSVLKYISECAEIQNKKNKKRLRTISFGAESEPLIQENDDTESCRMPTPNKKKLKKKRNTTPSDDLSGPSSKKMSNRSNQEVVRKCSKTVTNISKKGKKRTLRSTNINSRDWITFNRNNAGKIQRPSKSKTMIVKREEIKNIRKSVMDKVDKPKSNVKKEIVPPDEKVKSKIEHFDSVENKLIKDFFQNNIYQMADVNDKSKINDLIKKPPEKFQIRKVDEERMSFRTKTPLKIIPDGGSTQLEFNNDKMHDLPKRVNVDNKRNILGNKNGINENKLNGDGKKLLARRSLTNNKENEQRSNSKMSNKLDDRKSVISNMDLSKVLTDRFKEQREYKLDTGMQRAKSEIKVGSAPSNMTGKVDESDLEDVKVELDEFFSEIPFVVGRSISRTFNLGLSFQHAMSMLKRAHSKKEVKDVLSIGRPESVPYTESLHCISTGGVCEAMFTTEWTKEDEEAWEENPWDPDLNKRRPKCTCLPNNCTTLKKVLKQLSTKNPGGFNMRSLQPSFSSTTNKLESEPDLLKKPALKRAKSQTRHELLRNIRTIQIQLTPSTEMLK